MRKILRNNWLYRIGALGFIMALVLGVSFDVKPSLGAGLKRDLHQAPLLLYLPVLLKNYPPPQTVFGVEPLSQTNQPAFNRAKEANTYWLRVPPFSWAAIEPVRTNPPTYNWSSVNDSALQSLGLRGFQIIATIKYTPAWARAQKFAQMACGAIKPSAWEAFKDFVVELIRRYSGPPYNIKYWELGNEPDVDGTNTAFPGDSPFGCWGDPSLPYFGGEYYGQFLAAVYPGIKNADPAAQVMNGGLLLACDPSHDPNCTTAKFAEGMLNTGKNGFDILSFHGYAAMYGDGKITDVNFHGWDQGASGERGVVMGKITYLRNLMQQKGVNKPLLLTEGALVCPDNETNSYCYPNPTPTYFDAQADYVAWLFVRIWAAGLKGAIWYSIDGPGWRSSGLLDMNQQPRDSYYAYKWLTTELDGASYLGVVAQYPSSSYPTLRAYEFSKAGKRIWVMWDEAQVGVQVNLPGNLIQVFDRAGTVLPYSANDPIMIKSPVYAEVTP